MNDLNIEKIINNIKGSKNTRSVKENLEIIVTVSNLVQEFIKNSSDKKVLFAEFEYLSIAMNFLDMDGEKQLEYISSFVEENLETDAFNENKRKEQLLDMDKADYEKVEKISKKFHITMTPYILSKIYEKYIENKPLSDFEQEVINLTIDSLKKTENFEICMTRFNEKYLQKKDTYTIEEISGIINILKDMKVEYDSCVKIKKSLVQKYKNRINPSLTKKDQKTEKTYPAKEEQETEKTCSAKEEQDSKKNKNMLNSKQYNTLRNEVEKIISLKDMEVKEKGTLKLRDRIEITSKLVTLGWNKIKINNFLLNSDLLYHFILNSKKNKKVIKRTSLNNLIELYQDNYKRYNYYNKKYFLGVDDILDSINFYIELSKEESDLLQLNIIKEEIYNNIVNLNTIIPKSYEYELIEAEKEKVKYLN